MDLPVRLRNPLLPLALLPPAESAEEAEGSGGVGEGAVE